MVSSRSFQWVGGVVLFAVFLSSGMSAAASAPYKPGELLIKYRPSASATERALTLSQIEGVAIKHLGFIGWDHLLLRGTSVEEAMRRLQGNPWIEHAEPNYRVEPLAVPNDPKFFAQWGLHHRLPAGLHAW